MTTLSNADLHSVEAHRVTGGGGVELRVDDTGNRAGRAIVFIHGFSQCRLAWRGQMASDLRDDFRLLAVDLRGHGDSGRPRDAFGDSRLWADDLDAVITALDLQQPVLCGWSYGGAVIGDYLSVYGQQKIGGIALVGAVSRLGEPLMPFLGEDFVAVIPGLFADDQEECTAAVEKFIGITTSAPQAMEDYYLSLGYNLAVSSSTRKAMLSRTLNHDNLFGRLSSPALLIHGVEDKVVQTRMSAHLAGLIPRATLSWYEGVGHSPFLENPERFNADLCHFVASL